MGQKTITHPEFKIGDWTQSTSYSAPSAGGVYAITTTETVEQGDEWVMLVTVLYIGSSANLFKRFKFSQMYLAIRKQYEWVNFYFIEIPDADTYKATEINLIKSIKPLFNSAHNPNRNGKK